MKKMKPNYCSYQVKIESCDSITSKRENFTIIAFAHVANDVDWHQRFVYYLSPANGMHTQWVYNQWIFNEARKCVNCFQLCGME